MLFSLKGGTAEFNSFLEPGWFSVLAVKRGSFKFDDGKSAVVVGPFRLYAVPNSYKLEWKGEPSEFFLVSCSLALAVNSRIVRYSSGYLDAITAQSGVVLSLSRTELRYLFRIAGLLEGKVSGRNLHEFADEIALLCLNLLLYEYAAVYERQAGGKKLYRGHPEKTAVAFIGLLDLHARDQHDVGFYADALCVSTGHLRKCVRSATGMPAKYFIETALVSEAYLLLADERLSVTEVSELLCFGTLSSFSHFFKKHAGFSPSEYRMRLRS